MILSAQTIRSLNMIHPFHERTRSLGMTFGLSSCGYDVRVAQNVSLRPKGCKLASTVERFSLPNDVTAQVMDKSSWARQFVTVQNTIIEPGWFGYLTLEIINHSNESVLIEAGSPIAQIVFSRLDEPTEQPYGGKYQNQQSGPQPAILERSEMVRHRITRQGDEFACECGARWDAKEMHP